MRDYDVNSIVSSYQIEVTERNGDSYLSAGEMPLPVLYFIMSTVFLASGCFWVGILCKSK